MPASDRERRLRIVVLGYVVRSGMGGMAWHYLHYVLGLARMGHEVTYVEDSGDDPWSCYDPVRDVTDADPSYGLALMARSAAFAGIGDRWAYYDAHERRWHGPSGGRASAICNEADLVLNVSGANPLRAWFDGAGRRVYVDTDPVFTQVRNLTDPRFRERTAGHDVFVSFAEGIGAASCSIPDDGFAWRPTRQPVVLDAWPSAPPPPDAPFSTVMHWRTRSSVDYMGEHYGTKEDSFGPYLDLPRIVARPLELALGGKEAPRDLLVRSGWRLRDPRAAASDPAAYQRYIGASRAEFGVAKHGYVASRSGWFSERSACYLAAGRPVVTQETGFGDHLPTGSGLLAYGSPAEAADGVARVDADFEVHSTAAREIAHDFFDHERVLKDLVEHAS